MPVDWTQAAQTFRSGAARSKDVYLTMGRYDLVCVIEGPDDETVAQALLSLGAQGNVQSETMKAFTEEQYRRITGSV